MDFLLVALLVVWSFGACFLPLKERVLRSVVSLNAVMLAAALFALAVPTLGNAPVTTLGGFFVMDSLRALLTIPMALAWVAGTGAFVLWWGASFKSGTGNRTLFCLRSLTFIGAFAGVLLMFLANSFVVMLGGLVLAFFMAAGGVLFQISDDALKHVRMFVVGCGVALVVFAGGIATLLISGFQQTGKLLLTNADVIEASMSGANVLALGGIALTGFSILWFMGLLPGLAWYRRGIAHLPKGQRLIMRVMLPVALFPHVMTLAEWGGEGGELFIQKVFLGGSFFAALTLFEYIHTEESAAEISMMLLLAVALVSMAYGPAGAIPALMIMMMFVLLGASLLIGQGGVWWKPRVRAYATWVIGAVPVISPLCIPYGLSVGYGIQMMPVVATITAALLVCASATLAVRVSRAWSEGEPTYADLWSGKFALALLVIMTAYGCWFLSADSLALVVKSVGA